MARPKNIPDAYSPLLIELLLQQGAGKPDVRLPAQQYLRSIQVEITNDAAWTATVVLYDPEGDYLENLLSSVDIGNRFLKFRWGWDRGDGVSPFPLMLGQMVTWEPAFTEQGVELSIDLTAAALSAAILDKRVRSYPEGKRVSDIVREIAADRGWPTQDTLGRDTIEDTDGTLDKPIQNYEESDYRFVRDQLVPLAANKDGERFMCYFNRDEIHFHSKGFLTRQNTPVQVAKTYTFARDAKGEVLAFTPRNASMYAIVTGGENAVYTFVDERTGRRIEIETTREGGPDNVIVTYPDEKATVDTGDGVKARIHIPARSEAEGRMLVRAAYGLKREQPYEASIEVRGTHEFDVGDFIEVKYHTRSGREHYLSGMFFVTAIQHQIDAGSWTTTAELIRSGQGLAPGQPSTDVIDSDKKRAVQTEQKGSGQGLISKGDTRSTAVR